MAEEVYQNWSGATSSWASTPATPSIACTKGSGAWCHDTCVKLVLTPPKDMCLALSQMPMSQGTISSMHLRMLWALHLQSLPHALCLMSTAQSSP